MIRFMVASDLDEVVALSHEFYKEINLDAVGYRFDEPRIRESYLKGIDGIDHFVLLSIERGKLLGLFFFSIRDEHYYFRDRKFGSEIVWHTDPKLPGLKRLKTMMELFEAGEMFMQSRGVLNIYCGLDARKEFFHPGITKYLDRKGYTAIVTMHHREIADVC